MTRAEIHEKRISEWSHLIQEAQDSTLSIKEWCLEKGIHENTFYYWKRQLRSQNGESRTAPAAPVFVELDISPEVETPSCSRGDAQEGAVCPEFLIQLRECRIAVSQGFQEEDLMKVLRVASHVQ
ncbi:MAG: transposase [Lachnospiraceae bacterium]|nr:transposase [Lachnospiraceae bacterium]